ncbi:MAG: GntR family transcriptional regulator [Gemmataceae bacterium]|nr:GntR family transcriptional regulator [Gemmataceae bacterium]MCI0740705.1 GntR family transcriptional regulator [Gemmataceae bacterium]
MVRNGRTLKCHHGQRRYAIVQSLLTEVFQGQLRAGQHLVAQDLAKRMGVSQTPIREALIELAGIGIVDWLPNRGVVVRRVTAKDVRDICQVRKALECEATRCACGRIELAELHEIADELRSLFKVTLRSLPTYIQKARAVDSRLHDLIAASSGNPFLANELNRLKMLFRAFRDITYSRREVMSDYRRLADEAHEHLAIVEALIAGDARAAGKAMARHIRAGVKYWTRAMPLTLDGAIRPRSTTREQGINGTSVNGVAKRSIRR